MNRTQPMAARLKNNKPQVEHELRSADGHMVKKDIPKRKMPFFFTLKSLSNKQELFFTS